MRPVEAVRALKLAARRLHWALAYWWGELSERHRAWWAGHRSLRARAQVLRARAQALRERYGAATLGRFGAAALASVVGVVAAATMGGGASAQTPSASLAVQPLTVVPATTQDVAIGDVTITPSTAQAIGDDYVCLRLPRGDNFDAVDGLPAVSQSDGAATTGEGAVPVVTAGDVALSATPGDPGSSAVQGNVLSFRVSGTSQGEPPVFVLSGVHVDGIGAAIGPVRASVRRAAGPRGCSAGGGAPTTALGHGVVYRVGASSGGAIYGSTPAATTAAEFEAALVSTVGTRTTCSDGGAAVLATDKDPYDALSAAYLEAQLGTGVLLTSPGGLSRATLGALREGGVQRVYVVGGPLAVGQADIDALKSTPAYRCGGEVRTGRDLAVYTGIYGRSAEETAAKVDGYITGDGAGALPSIASAYGDRARYNQTSGNESARAPLGATTTAIVVADTDWEDATVAAGLAYRYKLPVILTPGATLDAQARFELEKLGVNQVVALGGPLVLSPAVVDSIESLRVGSSPVSVLRIAGKDPQQTAADVALFEATQLDWPETTLLVAQGRYWSDALGSGPLSARQRESLLLTDGPLGGPGSYTLDALRAAGASPEGLGGGVTTSIQVLGGPLAVPGRELRAMDRALGGR